MNTDPTDELTRLRAEVAELKALYHTSCQQRVALEKCIHEIYLQVEGDVDGAPDRSAVSSQANSIVNLIPEHLRK